MAYIDKDDARRLVKSHWSLFKRAFASKKDCSDVVKSIVAFMHTIVLLMRCILVCGMWLGLNYLDSTLGVAFLLTFSLIQTKSKLDTQFDGVDTLILEAVEEERRLSESVSNEEESSSSG